jgi:hypothetical protein
VTCASCGRTAARIRILGGRERCESCGGFSGAAGFRSEGVLSRQRVRADSVKHEGDVLNPWEWDRTSRSFRPNDEFVKLHAANARGFYTPDDLRDQYPALAEKVMQGRGDQSGLEGEVEGIGESDTAIREAIENA